MNRVSQVSIDDFEFVILDDYSLVITPVGSKIWSMDKLQVLDMIEKMSDLIHDDSKEHDIEDDVDKMHRIVRISDGLFSIDSELLTRYAFAKLLLFLEKTYKYEARNE